jgi:hypothetical protein
MIYHENLDIMLPGKSASAMLAPTDHVNAPVFILGVPRSGTSLVTGLLALNGLWVGRTLAGDVSNPKGYFENIALRDGVNKELLSQLGYDRFGVQSLPPAVGLPRAPGLRKLVLSSIAAEGYDGSRPWGFKDPKLTLTWPIWHQEFPQARWIVVRRPTSSVVQSCLRAPFMRRHSTDPKFWRRLVAEYDQRLDRMQTAGLWLRRIRASEIIEGQLDRIAEIAQELGLNWNSDNAQDFVDRHHWRNAQGAN